MTMHELPPELAQEREALTCEIHAAFKVVSREGGVSWNEAEVIDAYGSDEECARARASDRDKHWTDIAADPKWTPLTGMGGFSFMDAIGFRYYLPAAMLQNLRSDGGADIDFHLTLNKATKPGGIRMRDHTLQKWSLLDERQCRCIARFIRFMIAVRESPAVTGLDYYEATDWRRALERHWHQFSN